MSYTPEQTAYMKAEMRAIMRFRKMFAIVDMNTAVDRWIKYGHADAWRKEYFGTDDVEAKLKTFDWCSMAPDWIGDIWIGSACQVHDLRYGLKAERKPADECLRMDIFWKLIKHGRRRAVTVSNAYYAAVRAFGGIWRKFIKGRL